MSKRQVGKFEFGVKVRDRITGFAGVMTGVTRYITGCDQCLVQPPVKDDGTHIDARWIDDVRLELTNAPAITLAEAPEPAKALAGACDPAPIK